MHIAQCPLGSDHSRYRCDRALDTLLLEALGHLPLESAKLVMCTASGQRGGCSVENPSDFLKSQQVAMKNLRLFQADSYPDWNACSSDQGGFLRDKKKQRLGYAMRVRTCGRIGLWHIVRLADVSMVESHTGLLNSSASVE